MSAHTGLEVLRIFINENQKHGRRLLYEAIVLKARELGLIGAIVSRGIMGFWKFNPISTLKILELSNDLPISI
jgi:PII-like signaling protein